MRAIKRTKTRDKREQAHREALRAQQSVDKSGGPRSAAGRIPGAFAADSLTKAQQKVIWLRQDKHNKRCMLCCSRHLHNNPQIICSIGQAKFFCLGMSDAVTHDGSYVYLNQQIHKQPVTSLVCSTDL